MIITVEPVTVPHPWEIDHTKGDVPYCMGLLASHRIYMCKVCEMGLLFIILIRKD